MTTAILSGRGQPAPPENVLYRRTYVLLNFALAAGYIVLAAAISGKEAIEIYNGLVLAVALGVVVTYARDCADSISRPLMTGEEVLICGIFISWSAVILARGISIVWRAMGQDPSWLDSVAWGFHIPGTLMGGMSHLLAPKAVNGRIPAKSMTTIGVCVAAVMAAVSLLVAILT